MAATCQSKSTPSGQAAVTRHLPPPQVCGKFIPAGTPILLSTFLAQILTDPHLMPSVASLSRAELDRLEANWQSVNAALLQQEFRPERWLQGSKERTPSGLLTFRCVLGAGSLRLARQATSQWRFCADTTAVTAADRLLAHQAPASAC